MGDEANRAKKKSYYYDKKINSKKPKLEINWKGFICTCNTREKDCIQEAYNLLNRYADKLFPKPSAPNDEDLSIEDSLRQETESLKKTSDSWRFKSIESGAKNIVFIRTTLEDPVALTETIIEDIYTTKKQQTKFLSRLIPVVATCRAEVDVIVKTFEDVAAKYFQETALTFSIVFNHRNNNSLSKENVIKAVAEKISEIRSDHKVDLKGAQISVIIEVIKGFAFLGVARNYFKYKKYNLLSLCEESQSSEVAQEETT